MKHLHWVFVGYNEKKQETGMIDEPVNITVTDQALEALALDIARKTCMRKHYWLKDVFECVTCDAHEKQAKFMEMFLKRFEEGGHLDGDHLHP